MLITLMNVNDDLVFNMSAMQIVTTHSIIISLVVYHYISFSWHSH